MVIVPGIRTTLLAGLLLVTGCVSTGSGTPSVTPPPPPPETFITTTFQSGSLLVLQNQTVSDTVRIGLETNWGGSIVEVSLNGTNYVNAHDTGREIQPAFYDGNAQYDACAGRAGIEVSSWITTSRAALSIASMTAAGSSASATTGFAPMARRMPTLFGVRVMPVTACPALSSTGTSLRPMAPVAPATKTLICNRLADSFRFHSPAQTSSDCAIGRQQNRMDYFNHRDH